MSNLNDIINQQREEIAQLRTQLAKANERVKELEGDKDALMSRYGDNWYDGFMTAKDLGFDQYSESEILEMSEAYDCAVGIGSLCKRLRQKLSDNLLL